MEDGDVVPDMEARRGSAAGYRRTSLADIASHRQASLLNPSNSRRPSTVDSKRASQVDPLESENPSMHQESSPRKALEVGGAGRRISIIDPWEARRAETAEAPAQRKESGIDSRKMSMINPFDSRKASLVESANSSSRRASVMPSRKASVMDASNSRKASVIDAMNYTAVDNDEKGGDHPSRKRWWIAGIVLAILVVVGLAVGLGVGLTQHHGSSSSGSAAPTQNTTFTPPTTYNNTNDANGTYWTPKVGESWQIVLYNAINDTNEDADVWDIDVFDNTKDIVSELQKQGRKVICYFSAGSYENYRPDSGRFTTADYGNGVDGYPDEYWLNTNSSNVRSIMAGRLDLAVQKGCDGVDPDNVDGYENDTGLDLTEETAINYLEYLASEAHNRNLSIGLKNAGDIVKQTLDMMEWEINESCEEFNQCALFQPFIAAGKPVFHIEYPSSAPVVSSTVKAGYCNAANITGFSTVLKDTKLDNWIDAC